MALSAHWGHRDMAQVQLSSFLCRQLALLMPHNTFPTESGISGSSQSLSSSHHQLLELAWEILIGHAYKASNACGQSAPHALLPDWGHMQSKQVHRDDIPQWHTHFLVSTHIHRAVLAQTFVCYIWVNFIVEKKANVQGNVGNSTICGKSHCLKRCVKGFWREPRLWDWGANVKLALELVWVGTPRNWINPLIASCFPIK